MNESDYFTNICPQNKEMNNGAWHHFKAFFIKHQDAYHTIAFICPNNSDSVTIVGTAQSVKTSQCVSTKSKSITLCYLFQHIV